MATDRYVKNVATIKSQRSLFPLHRRTLFSYFHGYLQPVGAPIEILPGDTIKAKLSVFTRMSTPIVPIMDNIRQEVDAFFVPKRILWNKTKQFYGEAPSFGIAAKVIEPSTSVFGYQKSNLSTNILKSESFCGAFGIFLNNRGTGDLVNEINCLPLWAYLAVYNEYFRDENYQDQYTWNKDAYGSGVIFAYLGNSTVNGLSYIPQVNKDRDVVSSLLPYQIKGSPVTLSVGGTAPVTVDSKQLKIGLLGSADSESPYANNISLFNGTGPLTSDNTVGFQLYGPGSSGNPSIFTSVSGYVRDGGAKAVVGSTAADASIYPLSADLSNATAVKVSELIYAFAYQDFLARAAHFGTRYKEYIYGMFGTRIADATEDIPEYLGRLKFNINVNQVVQTTGFAPSGSSSLGALGAYSNSGNSGELFNKSFTEPGYIVIVSYTKHQRTYSSGIDRVFLKRELLDYYQPPFANIADVPFGSLTVWYDNITETSLGFQEPWWDYKGLLDRCYGLMNPMLDTLGEMWTLAEKWTVKPSVTANFMKEDRESIARVLTTGVNGPDYIVDVQFDAVAARVMPISSRTGLKVM